MKFINNKSNNLRSFIYFAVGFCLLGVAILIIVLKPVETIVEYHLSMCNGSFLYNLWKKPPVEIFIKVYIFNITNYDRFIQGLDAKLKVDEVGPYVYQEFVDNRDDTFNDNNTISFSPKKSVQFVLEKSIGDPHDSMIIVPNAPFMGLTTAAASTSTFVAFVLRALGRQFDSKVMLKLSVHEYLWGYEDPLVKIISKLTPNLINFEKFGLLDRVLDEGKNVVTMKLPSRGDVNQDQHVERNYDLANTDSAFENYEPVVRDFAIEKWNGVKGLKQWGYREGSVNTECGTVSGSYDGMFFPKNIKKGESFKLYRKAICRTLPIVYSHSGTLNGIDVYYFTLPDDVFSTNITDPYTHCFCKDRICRKRGLSVISPCYYNIPMAISFPHFYNSDPTLLNEVEGLQPDAAKHNTEAAIQPQYGVPLRMVMRLQVNLLMEDIKFNSEMSLLKNRVLPLCWLEFGMTQLPSNLILLLQLLLNVCPYIQLGFVIGFAAVGVVVLGYSILVLFCVRKTNPLQDIDQKVEIRRYSGAYLYPIIKKEINKFADGHDTEQLQGLTNTENDDS